MLELYKGDEEASIMSCMLFQKNMLADRIVDALDDHDFKD